jgi:hypothetical protein
MTFFKGSYYEQVPLFEPDETGRKPFGGLNARPLVTPEPILEHSVALKERLDSVAHHYYAESRDWRRIAEANPDAIFAEDLLWQPEAPVGSTDDGLGSERLGNVVLIPRRGEAR